VAYGASITLMLRAPGSATSRGTPFTKAWPARPCLLCGVTSGLYIGANLWPGPRDGLMTGLARRSWSLGSGSLPMPSRSADS